MPLLTFHTSRDSIHVEVLQERHRVQTRLDILQGTTPCRIVETLASVVTSD